MKLGFTLNQIAVTAIIVVGTVTIGAIFSGYSGFIEWKCTPKSCGLVIDGRSNSAQ